MLKTVCIEDAFDLNSSNYLGTILNEYKPKFIIVLVSQDQQNISDLRLLFQMRWNVKCDMIIQSNFASFCMDKNTFVPVRRTNCKNECSEIVNIVDSYPLLTEKLKTTFCFPEGVSFVK